ncbi:Rab-GTPase-TBC domain-containing protein [Chloropicon primus]|uniref:Rab-GTPase-TBC domain-containing protein n=1 Tax=Chloropicon primus TaxID=1764295 RepID=A0A5B8N1J4_9CHLO|nr:Rab-GTPase-TBC domain-containing protein [Chloropicon primus]UPR04906.1 Rab-GTPase-TBC domain-containing protein [Chloropicon primus]|eukprot:QDZ25710.1 Rab-GTPase-TBC domain-containing protein [Chloropicon primus]
MLMTCDEVEDQDVYYYQGLHDIASVLLLVLEDENLTLAVLSHLVKHHLRDCTRSDLIPVLESLELVFDLLKRRDRELHDHIRSSGVPCHFALSWRLTWFSHDVQALEECVRLFDAFLASPPLFPLYVGVIALCEQRERVLSTEPDFATMHQLLQGINGGGARGISEESIRKALQLYKANPPDTLRREGGPTRSGLARSYLKYLRMSKSAEEKGAQSLEAKNPVAWAWVAMLGFSGFLTATAALSSVVAFWEGNMQFQLL